jgi:hypothetical protein
VGKLRDGGVELGPDSVLTQPASIHPFYQPAVAFLCASPSGSNANRKSARTGAIFSQHARARPQFRIASADGFVAHRDSSISKWNSDLSPTRRAKEIQRNSLLTGPPFLYISHITFHWC